MQKNTNFWTSCLSPHCLRFQPGYGLQLSQENFQVGGVSFAAQRGVKSPCLGIFVSRFYWYLQSAVQEEGYDLVLPGGR